MRAHGTGVQIEAVGVIGSHYYDRTIPREQLPALVREVKGGAPTLDAEPRLFRLGVEALRTHPAHDFDPQLAVSVSQVDHLASARCGVQVHTAAASHPLPAGR